MKTIYFLRHGEPDFPEGIKLCLGRTDLPLSAKGREQALRLRAYFEHIPLAGVWCSDLRRARETAQLLCPVGCTLVSDGGFAELNMGAWDGKSAEQLLKEDPERYLLRKTDPQNAIPEGAEHLKPAADRFEAAAWRVEAKIPEDGAAVVTAHSGVMRLFFCRIQKRSLNEFLTIKQTYGCINRIEIENGRWRVAETNLIP